MTFAGLTRGNLRTGEGLVFANPAWPEVQHLTHSWTCACHSPQTQQLLKHIDRGLSRRSVLKGVAASLAAPTLGIAGPAFAQSPLKPILLTNVRIFDGTGSELVEDQDVLVEGNMIKALIAGAETVADADVIDCGGRTLMPGMIDAHWHSILAGISQGGGDDRRHIPYVHLGRRPGSRAHRASRLYDGSRRRRSGYSP